MEFFAKPNVQLKNHLTDVAEMSYLMASQLTDEKECLVLSYICGILHDIGKATKAFQEHLFDNEKTTPSHNTDGAKMVDFLCKRITINNTEYKSIVLSAINYHHPITEGYMTQIEDDINDAYELLKDLKSNIEDRFAEYGVSIDIILNDELDYFEDSSLQVPYLVHNTSNNAVQEINLFIRNILIPADNIASSCCYTGNDYKTAFRRAISRNCDEIFTTFQKPEGYDERFDMQLEDVKTLDNLKNPVDVFVSETGYGKTMFGLMYLLLNTDRKGFWICPQNSIAQNTYNTVQKELERLGLKEKVNIDLLLSGEYKGGDSNSKKDKSDIIITNIDNIYRPVLKSESEKLNTAYQILHGNCIFDEFHSYVSTSAIMSGFMTMLQTRKHLCQKCDDGATGRVRTLLLSATPLRYVIKKLNLGNCIMYRKNEKVLDKKIELSFAYSPLDSNLKNENTFICVNSRKYCQDIQKYGITNNLFHAFYLNSYKEKKFKELNVKHGDKKNISNETWVVTSIATTGLDISFQNGIFMNVYPNNFEQSLGRIDRWHTFNEIPRIQVLSLPKDKSERAALISITNESNMTRNTTTSWGDFYDISLRYTEFLRQKFNPNNNESVIITIGDIYNATQEFEDLHEKELKRFYNMVIDKSRNNLGKIKYFFTKPKSEEDEDKIYLPKRGNSLRENFTKERDESFIILKDEKTDEYIEEIYKLDWSLINKNKLPNTFWSDIYKETKRKRGGYVSKKIADYESCVKNMSRCNETPIYIPNTIYHNAMLGIIVK